MKKLNVSHFILAALFLALTVQVFNTSNLYIGFSNLPDPYKTIAGYFIGLSAEFSIFICIYAGSRAAGGWFAIITFFAGILFHDHWKEVYINIDERYFHFPTPFLSSTLLQFMNSVLVWFLSELFIEKQKITENMQTLAELNETISETKQRITLLNIEVEILNDEKKAIELQKTKHNAEYANMLLDLSNYEHKRDSLKQEITTLQKQKAGASKGINTTEQ